MSNKPIEAELRWLGGRRFWLLLLAALLLVAAWVAVIGFGKAGKQAPPQEAFLYGQPELVPGRASSFRLFVRDGAECFVYQKVEDHFDRRQVHLQYSDQRWAVIENDGTLRKGDQVAAAGAYQIHLAVKNKTDAAPDPHAGHNH